MSDARGPSKQAHALDTLVPPNTAAARPPHRNVALEGNSALHTLRRGV